MPATATKSKTMKFRLLRGSYAEPLGYKNGKKAYRVYKVEIDRKTGTRTCPIIESTIDLVTRFNRGEGKFAKFERVYEEDPAPVIVENPYTRLPDETVPQYLARLRDIEKEAQQEIAALVKEVDGMNKEQLEQFADENAIDLKGAKTVEQIRTIIKTAVK